MKKIITASMALLTAFCALAQDKPKAKTDTTAVKADTLLHLSITKAAGLFNLLNLSKEAILHTSSQKITVDQAGQASESIAYFQKLIKDWAIKLDRQKAKQ